MEFLTWLQNTGPARWVVESESIWSYPTLLVVHTIGLAIVVGASAIFNFRLLGVGQRIPISALQGIWRPMLIGFLINAISGAMLFAGAAETTGTQPIFYFKLGFILVALIIATVLYREVYSAQNRLRAAGANNIESLPAVPAETAYGTRGLNVGRAPLAASPPSPWVATLAVLSLVFWSAAMAAGRWMAYS